MTPLSVKLGIGCGECALLHVGGIFRRAEFFTVGEALRQALASEGDAVGGDIICSKEVMALATHKNFEAKELKTGNFKII